MILERKFFSLSLFSSFKLLGSSLELDIDRLKEPETDPHADALTTISQKLFYPKAAPGWL